WIYSRTNEGTQSEGAAAGRRARDQHVTIERSRGRAHAAAVQHGQAAAAGAENLAATAPAACREAAAASRCRGGEAAAASAGVPDRQRQTGLFVTGLRSEG